MHDLTIDHDGEIYQRSPNRDVVSTASGPQSMTTSTLCYCATPVAIHSFNGGACAKHRRGCPRAKACNGSLRFGTSSLGQLSNTTRRPPMPIPDDILDAIDEAARECAEWDVKEVDEYEAPVDHPLRLDGHHETFREAVAGCTGYDEVRQNLISANEAPIDAPLRYPDKDGQMLRGREKIEAGEFFRARYEWHCEQMQE